VQFGGGRIRAGDMHRILAAAAEEARDAAVEIGPLQRARAEASVAFSASFFMSSVEVLWPPSR